MSKYEVTLKVELEIDHNLDDLEALEETLYEELSYILETTDLTSICTVEEAWNGEKPELIPMRGYPE